MNDELSDKYSNYISNLVTSTFKYVQNNNTFDNVTEAHSHVMALFQQALLLNGFTMKLTFDQIKKSLIEMIDTQKDNYEANFNQIFNKK